VGGRAHGRSQDGAVAVVRRRGLAATAYVECGQSVCATVRTGERTLRWGIRPVGQVISKPGLQFMWAGPV
jgi:hypothetical protein